MLPSHHTKVYLVCLNIVCAHGLLFSWFHISLTPWLQIGQGIIVLNRGVRLRKSFGGGTSLGVNAHQDVNDIPSISKIAKLVEKCMCL